MRITKSLLKSSTASALPLHKKISCAKTPNLRYSKWRAQKNPLYVLPIVALTTQPPSSEFLECTSDASVCRLPASASIALLWILIKLGPRGRPPSVE